MATKSSGILYIDPEAVGVEVSWSFGNGDADAVKLPRSAVRAALGRHGFDTGWLPDKEPALTLKHAGKICRAGRGIVVRELERPNRDTPYAVGVYEVRGVEGESGDNILCGARVRCEGQVVCLPPEESAGIDSCMVVGERIAAQANEMIDCAYNKDVSVMLLELGWHALNWVSRRRVKGGVYFVLADTERSTQLAERYVALLKDLEQMSAAAEGCQRFVPEVTEVFPRPLSMGTIAGAVEHSFEVHLTRLMRDLKRAQGEDGKMREKTIVVRAAECDDLVKRAEQYRRFLAGRVDELGGQLTDIRRQFAAELEETAEAVKEEFAAIDGLTADGGDSNDGKLPPKKRGGRRRVSTDDWATKPFDESFFDIS